LLFNTIAFTRQYSLSLIVLRGNERQLILEEAFSKAAPPWKENLDEKSLFWNTFALGCLQHHNSDANHFVKKKIGL